MSLAARLRAQLAGGAERPPPFMSDIRRTIDGEGTPAAVLAAITDRAEPGLILTQRPETMRRHAGQVAFPGGRVDPEDVDAVAAALREAEEEVALPRAAVEVVGALPAYRTVTGFDITPVVGVIAPDLPLVPDAREVAAVFEVPLAWALAPTTWEEKALLYGGEERRYLEAWWEGRRIWGATAAMLANLAARLR